MRRAQKLKSKAGVGWSCLLAAILFATSEAHAQSPAKPPRIAYLGGGAASLWHGGFEEGLRGLGYQPGRDIIISYRWYEAGGLRRAEELANEILIEKPDILVTAGPPGAFAAKAVAPAINSVFVGVTDPVKAGLASTLRRPGGNRTGLAFDPDPRFVGKTVQLFRQIWPNGSRLGLLVLRTSATPTNIHFPVVVDTARSLGIDVSEFPIRSADDLDPTFAAIRKAGIEAVFVFPDPVTVTHHKRIVQLGAEGRLPLVSTVREFVDAGAIMSYGPSLREQARRAAHYVDKILKGAKPADLPVEQPTKFELVINVKAARAAGLTIPGSLSLQADQLVE